MKMTVRAVVIGKWTQGFRNKKTGGEHPNYNIVDLGQNTKKSPEDLRRLTVTQSPVKDHQLTLMWKTLMSKYNNNNNNNNNNNKVKRRISTWTLLEN